MDFDEDMSGLQIEDLGEYFLQTDINDNWKGFSLGYTDEEQQQQQQGAKQVAGTRGSESAAGAPATSAGGSAQHLTSPPLSSISEMLKHGNGLGVGLGFGSPRNPKDFTTLFQTGLTPASAKPDAAMMNRSSRDAMELAGFSLDQHKKPPALMMPHAMAKSTSQLGGSIKPAAPKLPSPHCQNILSSDDDDMNSFGGANTFKRGCSTIASTSSVSSISAPSPTPEDDRGFRKKSREKMRRQEVNVKFEELVELLGLSNRVRKSAILQEAVSAIKSLKRERDELRRDRDRLQQEVSKLATCLQYSHLGSVAAANAVAMTQQPSQHQQLSHMNPSGQHMGHQQQQHDRRAVPVSSGMQPVHTHPLNVPCNPGTNCFPLSSAFSAISSQLGAHSSASASSASGQVVIAPKSLKPAPPTSSFTPIAPDSEMK